jgi:hypothetical protein
MASGVNLLNLMPLPAHLRRVAAVRIFNRRPEIRAKRSAQMKAMWQVQGQEITQRLYAGRTPERQQLGYQKIRKCWEAKRRLEALQATGDSTYRKCVVCKKYDDPEKMYKTNVKHGERYHHRSCKNAQRRRERKRVKFKQEEK